MEAQEIEIVLEAGCVHRYKPFTPPFPLHRFFSTPATPLLPTMVHTDAGHSWHGSNLPATQVQLPFQQPCRAHALHMISITSLSVALTFDSTALLSVVCMPL